MDTWDAWTKILEDGGLDLCGIYGSDGNPWSQKNMCCPPDKVKSMMEVIKSTQKQSDAQQNGVHGVVNSDWVLLRVMGEDTGADHPYLMLKERNPGNTKKEGGSRFLCMALSKTAAVVGSSSNTGMTNSDIVTKVLHLTKSLANSGY